jgi:ubiquinone/menaquinone biosynthesis C-methylase UbiE
MPSSDPVRHANSGTEPRRADEHAVRSMYERAPYPDLGARLKDARAALAPVTKRVTNPKNLRFIDVGCGTGHFLVSAKKCFPSWQCYGLDLSDASLGVAQRLADLHGVSVTLARGSYLDPLPFDAKQFDVISAQGTIHHSADPVMALQRLAGVLAEDGCLLMHLYGWRLDRRKFEIKEILNLFEPDLFKHEARFTLYRQLMRHEKRRPLQRLASLSLLDAYRALKRALRNFARRRKGLSWSLPWTDEYKEPSAPWIDHFCHPCERAYEVPDVRKLIAQSGLELVEMLGQGRPEMRHIPPEWRNDFEKLGEWESYRLVRTLPVFRVSG